MKYYVALLFVIIAGCAKGTGTGNPFQNTSNPSSGDTPVPANSVSGDIFINLCMNIQRCHPTTTVTACDDAIASMTTFGPKLGLTAGSSLTALQIVDEEDTGQLTANSTAGLACVSALNALSCSDANMAAAYEATAAEPFANAANILDPICAGTF